MVSGLQVPQSQYKATLQPDLVWSVKQVVNQPTISWFHAHLIFSVGQIALSTSCHGTITIKHKISLHIAKIEVLKFGRCSGGQIWDSFTACWHITTLLLSFIQDWCLLETMSYVLTEFVCVLMQVKDNLEKKQSQVIDARGRARYRPSLCTSMFVIIFQVRLVYSTKILIC